MIIVKRKVFYYFIILLISTTWFCLQSYADTVYLKDEISLKGIVVKNYADRIIYSTIDGEKEILKSEITRIEYDEPLDNLIGLGDSAFEGGYYKAALKYYLMAQQINPNITALNNKIYHTETTVYKTPEIRKREHLALKNEVISGRRGPALSVKKLTPSQALQKKLGIYISRKKHARFYINDLTKDSPFKKAGVLKDDALIAIWSNLCDYLTFKDLYDLLINTRESMLKVTIERNLKLQDNRPFGARIVMKWEGAVVESVSEDSAAKRAGLKKGDLIVTVGGKLIRYIPLKTVLKWLSKKETTITIQRRLTVFITT